MKHLIPWLWALVAAALIVLGTFAVQVGVGLVRIYIPPYVDFAVLFIVLVLVCRSVMR